nr:hypothetical protein [Tanacetum cinerariifolium]
ILRKFGLSEGKSASTPIDADKPLLNDSDGEDVDVHTYRSMIGSLMYLTSSRPDIMFVVCACARFQVTLKVSHLNVVKRILEGNASLRLISWQCKKQTVVATSSTEAEYVAAASGCAQVLWMQNQLLDYGNGNQSQGYRELVLVKSFIAMCEPNTKYNWERIQTMTTQSAGRPAAASRGGGTGGRAGRGGGRTRGRSGDQGVGRNDGLGGQAVSQGSEVNDAVNGVPNFSTIISQQLENLLPTIVAQVGGQGGGQWNGRNQNGNAVDENIQGYAGDSQKVKYTAGSFVGKALRWWNSQIHTRGREAALLELMLLKRSKENTKCVSAAGEELTAATHKLELMMFRDVAAAAHMKLELKLFKDAAAASHMK